MHTERFAPSPTGPLHIGHAFSAFTAYGRATAAGGRFLLRIEDLDQGRARPEFVEEIFRDLAWLGLDWPRPVLFQSSRGKAYARGLAGLEARGLLYRCACSRRDIAAAVGAPQEGASPAGPDGPDGPAYPGTCRGRALPPGTETALRLDMGKAIAALGGARAVRGLAIDEEGAGPAGETGRIALDPDRLVETVGDVVMRRRDGTPAYHLAVVLDDAHQGITHVTRGQDLFPATAVHRLLQALLGLPVPRMCHHRLIRDAAGRRLAKRDRDRALGALRESGATPADIRRMVGL